MAIEIKVDTDKAIKELKRLDPKVIEEIIQRSIKEVFGDGKHNHQDPSSLIRSEEEIKLKIQEIKASGEMAFGDEEGGYERGKHDALLWVLKYKGEI